MPMPKKPAVITSKGKPVTSPVKKIGINPEGRGYGIMHLAPTTKFLHGKRADRARKARKRAPISGTVPSGLNPNERYSIGKVRNAVKLRYISPREGEELIKQVIANHKRVKANAESRKDVIKSLRPK